MPGGIIAILPIISCTHDKTRHTYEADDKANDKADKYGYDQLVKSENNFMRHVLKV